MKYIISILQFIKYVLILPWRFIKWFFRGDPKSRKVIKEHILDHCCLTIKTKDFKEYKFDFYGNCFKLFKRYHVSSAKFKMDNFLTKSQKNGSFNIIEKNIGSFLMLSDVDQYSYTYNKNWSTIKVEEFEYDY